MQPRAIPRAREIYLQALAGFGGYQKPELKTRERKLWQRKKWAFLMRTFTIDSNGSVELGVFESNGLSPYKMPSKPQTPLDTESTNFC
jgi:hypothetical protein